MKDFEGKTLPKGLTEDEFVKLIKVIPQKDKIARVSFLLGYGSGLRVSEIAKLKKENIQENFIQIWEAKGRDRTVPKPKLWKQWMMDSIPFTKTIRTLERKFKKYAKIAGLPEHYVFHSLRHGFGLRAIERGIPANQVQLLMGHSSLSVTNVYTKARPQDALDKYGELF
jgi:integrase/recombinase XerD